MAPKISRPEALAPLVDTVAELRNELRWLREGVGAAISDFDRRHTAALAAFQRPEAASPSGELTAGERIDYDRIARSPLMDPNWYLARHFGLVAVGFDSILHYLRHGWREGLAPGPAFDGAAYLAANPDVAGCGVNPLLHFLTQGAVEERPIGFRTLPEVPTPAPEPIAISVDLRSLDEYLAFQRERPDAFSDETEKAVRDHAIRFGIRTALLGALPPEATHVGDGDLREHLASGGLSSRTRAVADEVLRTLNHLRIPDAEARVYGHEAITHLAGLMRARFPRYVGTEYAPTPQQQQRIQPILHNDVCESRFADASFDVTFSCDVMEHVYDRDAMLREAARTLRPQGVFLATFPFDMDVEPGWLFAELIDGTLVHHMDKPIYHGNPVDEEGGSLVFEIMGWDVVRRAKAAGFSDAVMRFICDQERGITASFEGRRMNARGVFMLVGVR